MRFLLVLLVLLWGTSVAASTGEFGVQISGSNIDLSLTADIRPSTGVGVQGKFFVGAVFPDGRWFFLTSSGWQQWFGGEIPPYSSGVLAPMSVQVLSHADVSSFIGASVYVGYGASDSAMLAGGTYAMIYSVVGIIPTGNTLVANLTLPSFPHKIDIYSTSVATKAIVFLHGGGGRNYEFAHDMGLNLNSSPPTPANINWNWINTNKILAVFPQGQAISSHPTAYTWSNHVMTSGVDDVAFLKSLAAYITSQYGIYDIYLVGHSNGGMMVNRFWCESPATFKAYVSMSGPASAYYLNALTPCDPSTVKPYYGIVGEMDQVLQIPKYGGGSQEWVIDPFLAMTSGAAMPDPTLIGEWWQQTNIRGPRMCGEVPSPAGYVTDGRSNTWSSCNGHLKLQEVLLSGHSVPELEQYSGKKMIDLISSFINVP